MSALAYLRLVTQHFSRTGIFPKKVIVPATDRSTFFFQLVFVYASFYFIYRRREKSKLNTFLFQVEQSVHQSVGGCEGRPSQARLKTITVLRTSDVKRLNVCLFPIAYYFSPLVIKMIWDRWFFSLFPRSSKAAADERTTKSLQWLLLSTLRDAAVGWNQ